MSPRLLLFWKSDQIGDVLQRGSAVAAALRSIFPHAVIDLLTGAVPAPLMRCDANFRHVHEATTAFPGNIPAGDFAGQTYDALINLGGTSDEERADLRTLLSHFLRKNPCLSADLGMHDGDPDKLIRQITSLARDRQDLVNRVDYILGESGLPRGFRGTIRLDPAFRIDRPAAATGRKLVFLHTASNAPARCYHGDRAALVDALESAGYVVWDAESRRYDLREVAWMIGGSDYVVTVDTSILHIANALRVPSLCMVAQVLGSFVGADDVIFEPVSCVGCVTRGIRADESVPCPSDFGCMRVDPAEVVARVDGYFRMQTLVDSPELRRYLHVRRQTLEYLRAVVGDFNTTPRGFDLRMLPPPRPTLEFRPLLKPLRVVRSVKIPLELAR